MSGSHYKTTGIAALSVAAILAHLALRFGFHAGAAIDRIPLVVILAIGGVPLVYDLLKKLLKREFGSDLLGGISIITSVLLGEYLAGSIIVLMLAGGEALESYALRSASSVLEALAKRLPSVAHRKRDSAILDVGLQDVAVGDTLVIYPHDICPVDGASAAPPRSSRSRRWAGAVRNETVETATPIYREQCRTGDSWQRT